MKINVSALNDIAAAVDKLGNTTADVTARLKEFGVAMKLRPTVDTWVAKNDAGELVPIKVVDMTDGHIRRWIHYFRGKVRQEHPRFNLPNAKIDGLLIAGIPTARAIFAEATKRGLQIDNLAVVIGDVPDPPKAVTPMTKQQRAERLITLEDE